MTVNSYSTMTPIELKMVQKEYSESEKKQIRVSLPIELLEFIEQEAFKDFQYKKGSVGMELTKLILIAKETITK